MTRLDPRSGIEKARPHVLSPIAPVGDRQFANSAILEGPAIFPARRGLDGMAQSNQGVDLLELGGGSERGITQLEV